MAAISDSSSSVFHDMLKPLAVIVVAVVVFLLASELIGAQFSSLRFGSRGRVRVYGAGIYWDAECTDPVYSLDWGGLEPGSVMNVSVFIRNEGSDPSVFFMNTTSWSPLNASDFIALIWDYKGQVVYPQEKVEVMFTLSVAPVTEGVTDFDFEIIIGISG